MKKVKKEKRRKGRKPRAIVDPQPSGPAFPPSSPADSRGLRRARGPRRGSAASSSTVGWGLKGPVERRVRNSPSGVLGETMGWTMGLMEEVPPALMALGPGLGRVGKRSGPEWDPMKPNSNLARSCPLIRTRTFPTLPLCELAGKERWAKGANTGCSAARGSRDPPEKIGSSLHVLLNARMAPASGRFGRGEGAIHQSLGCTFVEAGATAHVNFLCSPGDWPDAVEEGQQTT